jgi:predicted aspartyl protease
MILLASVGALTLCAGLFMAACGKKGGDEQEQPKSEWSEWVVTTPATCETEGERMRTYITDSDRAERQPIPATGHDWGEWEVTPATYTAAGVQTRVCRHDSRHTETEILPQLVPAQLSKPTVAFDDETDTIIVSNVDANAAGVSIIVDRSTIQVFVEKNGDNYTAVVGALTPGQGFTVVVKAVSADIAYTDSEEYTAEITNYAYRKTDIAPATVIWDSAEREFIVSGMDGAKATYALFYDSAAVELTDGKYKPAAPENGKQFSVYTAGKQAVQTGTYTYTTYNVTGLPVQTAAVLLP